MAWPNNNFNSFWEAMSGPNRTPNHPHGAGIDHAPPPPPELPPFANPDFWNRWAQPHGPWGYGAHGRRERFHGRHRGGGDGRGGRHGRNSGEDEPERGASAHDATDEEVFPPEYISDDEVAAATAAAEAEKKGASGDKEGSPDTMMQDNAADPPEEVPNPDEPSRPHHCGRHGRHGGRGGFGREGFDGGHHRRGGPRGSHHHGPGPFGFGLGGGSRRRSRGPHGHHHGPPPPPPFFEAFFGPQRGHHGPHGHNYRGPSPPSGGAFDFRGLMTALANHPAAHEVREYIERMQRGTSNNNNNNNNNRAMTPGSSDDEDGMDASFSPPLDIFEQADRWVLHLAVPGAKKEDVGINWDTDRSTLGISGVVYRPGDEQFLQGLVSGERSVGLFSREVRLPPVEKEAKEDVDSDSIQAKMEEGVLVITVPKVEKDWTEVKRVEIQ